MSIPSPAKIQPKWILLQFVTFETSNLSAFIYFILICFALDKVKWEMACAFFAGQTLNWCVNSIVYIAGAPFIGDVAIKMAGLMLLANSERVATGLNMIVSGDASPTLCRQAFESVCL